MKPEMEDGSLKRRETPDPCRPAAETVTSKIPNQLPLAKAGPESFEIRYPAELRTVQARKTFKTALLKDSPETLMADFSLSGETRTKTNLVFFTEQPAAWFNALCNTFRHFKRKGICNGRQLVITEDTDPDITVFTCNIYHNGTVLIQGCEASLDTFEQSFLTVKQQADKEKLRTDCTQQGRQGADCSAADATPSTEPARNTAQLTPSLSPKMLSPVKAIKDCLSDLEREFTEFRESVTAKLNQGESIEQLKDEINKIKNEHKVVVAELKAQASELQLENDRLKSDMKKVREELQKKAQLSETRSLHRELQSLKDTLAQTDIRSTTAPTRSENQIQPQIEKAETALAAVERQKGESQSQPSEGDILNSAVNPTQQQRSNTTTNTNTDIDNAEHEAPTPSPEEQTQPSNPQTSNKHPQPDVVILIDSNGRYLDERRLFPGKRITKIRCPNTERAFQIIAKPQFVAPKYIIIHTGTNDLPQHSEDLPKSLEQLVKLATQRFPAAKIILSTLLLRKDVPEHSIDEINRKISNSCARLPSVHVAHHHALQHRHLYDEVHLNQQGMKIFAKTIKDVTLGRDPARTSREPMPARHTKRYRALGRRGPQEPTPSAHGFTRSSTPPAPQTPPPPILRNSPSAAPRYHQKSYAAAAAAASGPADSTTSELSDIKQLLHMICSRLLTA